MFNLKDWDATRPLSNKSVLGRARRNPAAPGREPPASDAHGPQRSPATNHHIQTFLDALQNGDHAEQGLRNVPLHVHIQLMVPIPHASPPRYYLVDPAPYIPTPDYIP